MSKNNNQLKRAKVNKENEFYTQLVDIEEELKNYQEQFKDQVVYCNCDDPEWSNFYFFFKAKFKDYFLKKLITTHYEADGKPSYALILERERERERVLE